MKDRLEVIANRYNQINEMLLDMSIVSDIKKLTELSKELKLKQCEYQKKVFLENMQNYVIFKKIGIL